MLVAHYESAQDSEPASIEMTWGELVDMLTTHEAPMCAAAGTNSLLQPCAGRECKAKFGPAWSPVEIVGARSNANVKAITAAVFDLDHISAAEMDRIDSDIEKAGLAAILHSTHSHTPEDQCFRLTLQLSRPVLPKEWPAVRSALVEQFKLPADEQTKDLSRIYFLPTYRDGVTPLSGSTEGRAVDVDDILARCREPSTVEAAPTPPAVIDLQSLRSLLAATRRSKAHGNERERAQADVLGRILAGEPLAVSGTRDATLLRALGLLVYHLPAGTPWDAALEIIRPSLSCMDVEPEGLDHWIGEARKKFDRVVRARAAADARRAADEAAVRELAKSVSEKTLAKPLPIAADEWEKLLLTDKDGVRVCERNTQLLLANAPELKGTLRFNEVTKAIETRGGPFADVKTDVLDSAAAGWLQTHYDYFVSAAAVAREIAFVARQHTYDPLAEYLNELAWDGVSRVDSFLVDFFGTDDNEYTRLISKRWLVGLIARALSPGCEMQNVLILEGIQGAGKTRALRALAGDYYLGTAVHMGDKDFMQLISSAWLVELGELASFRRAETERVKQFIDQRADKFRAPYARVAEEWMRRCVFVGTTNESDYLTDRTGNRRYWPVRVSRVDVDSIRKDRDQILAEAVALFVAGERWWLDEEEAKLATAETEERMEASPVVEEAIERWWFGLEPAKRPHEFNTLDVAEQALHLAVDRVDHGTQVQIGRAIGSLGFNKVRRRTNGRVVWIYQSTNALQSAPIRVRNNQGLFSVIAGSKAN